MKRHLLNFLVALSLVALLSAGCDRPECSAESYGRILTTLPQHDDAEKPFVPPVEVDLNVDFSNDPFLN